MNITVFTKSDKHLGGGGGGGNLVGCFSNSLPSVIHEPSACMMLRVLQ